MRGKVSGAVLVVIFYALGSILVQAQTSKTVSPSAHQTITHGCFYMESLEIIKQNIKVPKEFARRSAISEQPLASQEILSRESTSRERAASRRKNSPPFSGIKRNRSNWYAELSEA
jgi:hypothetical protein